MPDPRPNDGSSRPRTAHPCAARGCITQIPQRLLMCRPHWRQVPADVRASVWLAYRRGQEDNGPSRAYINAATEAIEAVARRGRRHA